MAVTKNEDYIKCYLCGEPAGYEAEDTLDILCLKCYKADKKGAKNLMHFIKILD